MQTRTSGSRFTGQAGAGGMVGVGIGGSVAGDGRVVRVGVCREGGGTVVDGGLVTGAGGFANDVDIATSITAAVGPRATSGGVSGVAGTELGVVSIPDGGDAISAGVGGRGAFATIESETCSTGHRTASSPTAMAAAIPNSATTCFLSV
jgi:hypothetical protein